MSLPKPYYTEGEGDRRIVIYHADCTDILPALSCDRIGMVLTDPPYMVGAKGFADAWDPEVFRDRHRAVCLATSGPVVWFGASPRVERDLRHFVCSPERILIWAPRFTLSRCQSAGIFYRWHPIYCWRLPDSHDGPTWDVLDYPCDGHNAWKHPATKPLGLMQRLAGFCWAGGVICDPFLGSGTTLVAAKMRGQSAIGIEVEERYCEIAAKRLAQGVLAFEDPDQADAQRTPRG